MAKREVFRTYFQMLSPAEHIPAYINVPGLRLERVEHCPASFYRYLYSAVGRTFHWVDRANWADQQIVQHLNQPAVSLWVLYNHGAPAGYFELQRHPDDSIEIAYFGLLPEYHGRGLGKHLLSLAVEKGWEQKPTRLWLHTCSLDHPAAIPNYLRRGFRPYKQETYTVELPGE